MKDIDEIKELLLNVKRTYGTSRAEYISKLQDKIWEETPVDNEELEGVLSDLAGDLNFYETDGRDQDENLGYFGDKRLEEVINAALEKIDAYLKKS